MAGLLGGADCLLQGGKAPKPTFVQGFEILTTAVFTDAPLERWQRGWFQTAHASQTIARNPR